MLLLSLLYEQKKKKKTEDDIEISKNIIELINAFKKKFIKFFFLLFLLTVDL